MAETQEAKHTAGEWFAVQGNTNRVIDGAWGSIEDEDGWVLADIYCDAEELEPCAEANAYLMSAAPELFDALELIIRDLPQRRDWLDPVTEQMALAALKKARGEK